MESQVCHDCKALIVAGVQFLKVGEKAFHAEHFCCSLPHCRALLAGQKFYNKEEQFLCQTHYEEKYCHLCATCNTRITTGGVLQAFDQYYHPDHFRCSNSSCQIILQGGHF